MTRGVHEELVTMLRKRLRRYQSQAVKAAASGTPSDAQYWLQKAHDTRARIREMRAVQVAAEEGGDYVPTV